MQKSDIMTFVQRQENNIQKEDVIALYQKLVRFFESDDYGQCLRNELNESYPNYLINLQKRIKDLQKDDHGIVVAGISCFT